MVQKFPCREAGCVEQVEYVPSPIIGLLAATRLAGEAYPVPTEVHLLCPKGHEHSYDVRSTASVDGG